MKFRNKMALPVAASVVALTLAGCGGAADSGATSGAESAGTDNRIVTIGMNSSLVDAFAEYAEAFMEQNEGWEVKVEAVPDAQADYIQQLVSQGLSSTMPDIIFNYDSLNPTLAANGLLLDLKPWLEEGKDDLKLDEFAPNFLNQYAVGQEITGLPVSADSSMLFYNTEVFEKYGVDLPEADWTLEDMYRLSTEITDAAGGEAYGIATPISDASAYYSFYPTLKAYGAELYDQDAGEFVFASDDAIEAWEVLLEPYSQGFGTPFELKDDGLTMFMSGQIGMFVAARPLVDQIREGMGHDNWNVQQLPEANGASTTGGGSYGLSISTKSPNQEGAWNFLSWFYSTDGGMELAQQNSVVPATIDGLANGTWKEIGAGEVPTNLVPVTEYAVENAVLAGTIPDDVQPYVVPKLMETLEQVVLQGTPVKEAFTSAQDELNGMLAQ